MTRLLIIFIILLVIVILIYSGIRGIIRKFLSSFNKIGNNTQSARENKKSKVIYERDDVVVMKGDAPDNNSNRNPKN
jgi:predicted Holliday junction resolvase-like endonuclease